MTIRANTLPSHNRNFMAADCGFVVFAPSAAGLDGNQVLSRQQIEIERELHPCGVGIEELRRHHALAPALGAKRRTASFHQRFLGGFDSAKIDHVAVT